GRPKGRAIVKVGPAIPLTIPTMLLDILAHVRRFALAAFCKGTITTQASHLRKLHEHVIQEKSQPDAFASAVFADHVQAVVPVTGADEWEAVLPTSEALQNGSHAVFIHTSRFFRPARQIV